jgi:YHS domain-containing protein
MLRITVTALAAAALLSGLAAGAAAPKAKCIVSGKEIEVTDKTPRVMIQGKAHYFCCENCPKAFAKTPEKFVSDAGDCPVIGSKVDAANADQRVIVNNGIWYTCCPGCAEGVESSTVVRKGLEDVVSRKKFTATGASPKSTHKSQIYFFENAETKAAFDKDPAKYALVYGK